MKQKQNHIHKNMIVAAIAVSLSASAALVPVLSNIATVFPDFKNAVHLLLTIPPLLIMVVSSLMPKLNRRYAAKSLTVFAYSLLIVSGIYPYFTHSFELLILSRVLMGIALGILTPLSSSLPALYFTDESDVDKSIGVQTAFASFGGIIFSYLSGLVAQHFWKDVFLVQLLNFVPLIFILMFMNRERIVEVEDNRNFIIIKESMWINVLALSTIIATITFPLNLSLYIEEQALGVSTLAGTIGSMNSLIGFMIGLLFSRINRIFKSNTILIALAIIATSLLFMGMGTNLSGFYFFSFLFGLGTSLIMPSFVTLIYKEVKQSDVVRAISSLTIMMSVAQFISPYIINQLGLLIGASISNRLIVAAIILMSEWVILSVVIIRGKKESLRTQV